MIEPPAIALAEDLLGDLVQICLVTRDHKRTMDSLLRLGIGPFRVHTHHPGTTSETKLRGEPHSFKAVMAYAFSANVMWEVVEPFEGDGIFDEFLAKHGEGVHHFGFKPRDLSFEDAIAEAERRGFQLVQSGRVWGGRVGFAFLDGDGELGVYFELWDHPEDFGPPPPESWYPAPPAEAE